MKLEGFGTSNNPIDALNAARHRPVDRGAFEGALEQQHTAVERAQASTRSSAERPTKADHNGEQPIEAVEPDERDTAQRDEAPVNEVESNHDTDAEVGATDQRPARPDQGDAGDEDADAPKAAKHSAGDGKTNAPTVNDGEATQDGQAKEAQPPVARLEVPRPELIEQPTQTPAEQVVADLRGYVAQPQASAAPAGEPRAADRPAAANTQPTNSGNSGDDAINIRTANASGQQAEGETEQGRSDARSGNQQHGTTNQPKAAMSVTAEAPHPPSPGTPIAETPAATTPTVAAAQPDGQAVRTPSQPTNARAPQAPAAEAPAASTLVAAPTTVTTTAEAPTAAQAAPTATADLPDAEAQRITDRVVRGLQSVVNQRGGSLTLRLTPANLGSLRINVQIDGATVQAQFHASSAAAGQALRTNIAALRQTLEAQGLSVEQLNVTVQSSHQSGGAPTSAQQNNDDAPTDGRSRGQHGGTSGGRGDDREDTPPRRDFQRELLDLVA